MKYYSKGVIYALIFLPSMIELYLNNLVIVYYYLLNIYLTFYYKNIILIATYYSYKIKLY